MRTSSIVLLVILIVLVVGGVYYFLVAQNLNNSAALIGPGASSQAPGVPNTGGTPLGTSGAPSPIVELNIAYSSTTRITRTTTATSTSSTYLVATNGMTLYGFGLDSANTSHCSGPCAALWPPYLTSSTGALTGAPGIPGRIGTTTRADGTLQVTYNGTPLYFYANDKKPGDTAGTKIPSWFLINP